MYNALMQAYRQKADRGGPGYLRLRFPFAALAVTLAVVGLASFIPGRRLWGLNHLAFYPAYVRVIALAAMGLAFLPRTARCITSALMAAVRFLRRRHAVRRIAVPAAAAVSVGIFWLLRSSTLLLGDGRLVATNFEHASSPDYAVIVSSPRAIILYEAFAKGTALIYYYAARISVWVSGGTPVTGIQLVNCLLGGVFVFLLLRMVLKRQSGGILTVWTVFVILTSGAAELFFGYVENYTPLIFFGSLYVVSGLDYIQKGGGRRIAVVLVFLLLAVFMHVQGILLAPSFLLLLLWRWRPCGRAGRLDFAYILSGLVAAGALSFALFTGYGKHFLPALANEETYGVLSPAHLADIANELILLLPMALVTVGFVLAAGRRRTGRAAAGEEKDEDSARRHGLMQRFLLVILFPCLLFLMVFKPDLGMARDWDLFAMTALGLIPLSLFAARRVLGPSVRPEVERLTAPGVVMSTVLVLAWVGINASPDRSARRFEAILGYDLTRAPYAYEVLAQHYRNRGDMDGAIAAIDKGVSLTYNTRLTALAADLYEESGDNEEAIRLRVGVLARQPDYEGARRDLVLLLRKLKRYDELLEVSREGTRYHPQNPVYHYFYGMALLVLGDVEEGVDELLTCRRLGPADDVIADIDRVLGILKSRGHDIDARESATQFSIPER